MSDNTAILDTWFSSHRLASRDNVGETSISVDQADGSAAADNDLSYPGHSGREKDIRNVLPFADLLFIHTWQYKQSMPSVKVYLFWRGRVVEVCLLATMA